MHSQCRIAIYDTWKYYHITYHTTDLLKIFHLTQCIMHYIWPINMSIYIPTRAKMK